MNSTNERAAARAAQQYIANGWPVFLLGRTKRPVANCKPCHTAEPSHDPAACPCLTCHGFYAATLDGDRLAAMQRVVPSGLLAIRTGAASGLVVVDVDPLHDGAIAAHLMPPTAYVHTGSGGLHLYYRHPGVAVPCSQSHVAPGVDIRGDGGYVVAPPSIHPVTGRRYAWSERTQADEMPRPLIEACQPHPHLTVTAPAGPTPTTPGGGITSPPALLAAHLAAVERAPEGRRRTTLYGAARGVARMVLAGAVSRADAEAALTLAGQTAQQTPREIRAAIAGGFQAEGVAA